MAEGLTTVSYAGLATRRDGCCSSERSGRWRRRRAGRRSCGHCLRGWSRGSWGWAAAGRDRGSRAVFAGAADGGLGNADLCDDICAVGRAGVSAGGRSRRHWWCAMRRGSGSRRWTSCCAEAASAGPDAAGSLVDAEMGAYYTYVDQSAAVGRGGGGAVSGVVGGARGCSGDRAGAAAGDGVAGGNGDGAGAQAAGVSALGTASSVRAMSGCLG